MPRKSEAPPSRWWVVIGVLLYAIVIPLVVVVIGFIHYGVIGAEFVLVK
jgi:hypothetical protein